MRKLVLVSLLGAALLAVAIALLAQGPGAERHFVALSAEEREWLDTNRDHIVLTYDADYPPIEFQDKNGKLAGLAADITAKVEKMLGVTFQKRPSRDWHAVLASLESGEAHLEGGIVRTPERERFAYFTAPYIVLPHAIITMKTTFTEGTFTWASLKGGRVGVVAGYASETFLRERSQGQFEVVPMQNVPAGLRDVSFGVLDAFVENLATTSYYIEKDALTNLRVAGTTDHTSPISIGVSRKYPLLYSAVQKALAEIPREDIEAARKRWVALHGTGMLSPEHWRLVKLAALFSALLLLGLGVISYVLKRRLSEKVNSLRAAQQELLEQSERLALATEASNAGVWDLYPATGTVYFSDQWYTMLGYTPGPTEGSASNWAALVHPDDLAATERSLKDYIDSGGQGLSEAEYRMRQADGSWRWVLGKAQAIAWDKDGIPTRIVGLNLDIQKLKDVQEELRQNAALTKAAFDQTFQFSGLLDLDGRVVKANQRILDFAGVSLEDIFGTFIWDCPWWPDVQEAQKRLQGDITAALAGGVVRREVVCVDAEGNHALVDYSISPLTAPNGSVSHLIVEGHDITEIRRAEAALKASEEKFRAIFNNAPVGIFRTSFEGQVIEANAALARMHGCNSVQEYIAWAGGNQGQNRYVHPEDRQSLLEALLKTPSGVRMATGLRRKDGSTGHGIISAVLHLDEHGQPTFLDGTIEDITERKKAEEALRQSEEKFRAIFHNAPVGIFRTSFAGQLIEANAALAHMHGCNSVQEYIAWAKDLGKERYAHPEDRQRLLEALLKTPSGVRMGAELLRRDGSIRQSIISAVLHLDEQGQPTFLDGTIEDITERTLLELRLANQLAFQQALLDTIPYAVFYKGPDTRFVGFNKAYEECFGVRRQDLIGKRVLDLEYLPAEDREAYQAEDEAVIASVGQVEREMPFLFADGLLHHTLYSVTGFRLTDGTPGGLIGVIVDITELKQAEEALLEEKHFSETLLDSLPGIFYIYDADCRLRRWNRNHETAMGYSAEELRGRHIGDWATTAEGREQGIATTQRVLSEVRQIQGEATLRHKDGSVVPYILTGVRLDTPEGPMMMGVGIDITERKKAEEALLEEKRFTETLLDGLPNVFYLYDADLRLRRWNRNHEIATGFSAEELRGRYIGDWFATEESRAKGIGGARRILSEVRQGEHENTLLHKDGHVMPYILTGVRLDTPEGPMMMGVGVDITERKKAEEALRQSEERYRSVIQNMQDVYYRTDATGRIVMMSPSGLRLYGCGSMDEVRDMPADAFYMDPAERQVFLAKIQAEGVVRDYELTLRRKDGSPALTATTSNFYYDAAGNVLGVEGILRDITERKKAEEALRQSEERFSRIFEMAPESISFVRLKDSVRVDANAAFETITGYPRAEAIGHPVQQLAIWDDPDQRSEFLERLLADGHVKDYEFMLRRKDGSLRRVVSSAQLVVIAGEQCYVSVIHDITDERRIQELLIQSEKMMSVGNLAAGIAHEINNPLGIVHQAVQNLILRTRPDQKKNLETAAGLGLSMDLLQQYLRSRKLDVFLEDIQAAAMRASGIIRNMLNFSRRSESKNLACELHRIIDQAVFLASSDYDLKKCYDFKRIEIVRDEDAGLPPCRCTEMELEQVLLNLLRNAAQAMSLATPPTPSPRITIRLRAGEGCVRIEVADNGPGMPLEVQRKVFEPFFTTKPPGVGTGLGLSVSYFIVTKGHRGKMWVASKPGQGTTFFIELPAEQAEANDA